MALTTYTAATDIIKTLGTNPEDRPTLTDDTFKAKFDENSANIAAFLNAMITELASVSAAKGASCIGLQDSDGRFTATQVEAALAEIAGSGRTTETVKGLADLISTNDGKLTTHKAESTSYEQPVARDVSVTGTQHITLPFLAKTIIITSFVWPSKVMSFGHYGENVAQYAATVGYDGTTNGAQNSSIVLITGSGAQASGVIGNITEVGFDIMWTKVGSPTGTATMSILALTH